MTDDVTETNGQAGSGELIALRFELARARARAREAELLRDEAERRLLSERARNDRSHAQLVALRRSGSWRLTRPLRVLLREVRARRT